MVPLVLVSKGRFLRALFLMMCLFSQALVLLVVFGGSDSGSSGSGSTGFGSSGCGSAGLVSSGYSSLSLQDQSHLEV